MQGSIHIDNLAPLAFDGEMAIELAANQLQGQRDGDYWLPPYFARGLEDRSLHRTRSPSDWVEPIDPRARSNPSAQLTYRFAMAANTSFACVWPI